VLQTDKTGERIVFVKSFVLFLASLPMKITINKAGLHYGVIKKWVQ